MGVHYVAADQVEECWQLLRQSMRSISWECLAHLPAYSAWLARRTGPGVPAAPAQPAADRPAGAGRRWVLKNPSHLFALDALLAVYPDALVMQTHRAPARRSPRSAAWPRRRRQAGRTRSPARSSAGTSWSCRRPGSSGSRRARPARPRAVLRRSYEDLVAEPVGTAEAAYAYLACRSAAPPRRHAGLPEAASGNPAHRYALADFGLTAADVGERFRASTPRSCDNHGVSTKWAGGPARSGRRADVVQLAGELFAQKGYRATTVREIATPRASCPAACTTTSTPRSRSATRSCRASSTTCSPTTGPRWPRAVPRETCSSRSCGRPARPWPGTGPRWPCCRTTGATSAASPGSGTCARRWARSSGPGSPSSSGARTRASSAPTWTRGSPTGCSATCCGSRRSGAWPRATAPSRWPSPAPAAFDGITA